MTMHEGTPMETLTGESDAEWQARVEADAEQARYDSIDLARESAHRHLRDAATALRLADRAVKRLREDDLYDVDFEGSEGLYDAARSAADVALAAATAAVPKADS